MPRMVELINGWIWGWIWPLLAAPFIGSFAGVLIERLPAGRPVAMARSACTSCGHVLGAAELVPLASFAALRGRCRACAAPIPRFHLHVELAATALAASAALLGLTGAVLCAACALGWTLLALAWIDARHQRLPDVLTLPLLLAGLAEALWLDPDATTDRALAAALGYLSFRLLAAAYLRLRGREGLGQGDAKLLAAGGAWLGTGALGNVILIAALAALAYALILRARGGRLDGGLRLPFGPFLAVGIWGDFLLLS